MKNSLAPKISTWFSRRDWNERIIVFNASWFTVPMGTGVIVQNLLNAPNTGYWMYNLAYCFWILDIVLFAFFVLLGLLRCYYHPKLVRYSFQDFAQTSYVGAIPISLFTICVGILIFYHDHHAAVMASWVLWWIGIAITLWVGCAVLYVTYALQSPHKLADVTGVWLLSFIPFVVSSATGSTFVPYMNPRNQQITLVVSFLLWSVGLSMCCVILCIYFWRLASKSLPPNTAIVSVYITMGPLGMGSYAIQNLAVGLSTYIQTTGFTLNRSIPPEVNLATISAVAEMINWVGLLIGLFLTGWASFWFIEASISIVFNVPKRFNVGFWAFVFPVGVYTNSLCRLALDLNNHGMRGWAWTCVVLTLCFWIGCALATFYKGVWRGELFYSPGLEGTQARQAIDWCDARYREEVGEEGAAPVEVTRHSRPDGTFTVSERRPVTRV